MSSDMEIAAALRDGRYPLREDPVCAFAIGAAGETCRRCGASYDAHYRGHGRVTLALHRASK